MNVSKRTWIILGIAIVAILAAFASLYFEKEEEIKTLEGIEPETEKPPRATRKPKTEVVEPELTIVPDGTTEEQK
jgi:hypothetical protein